MQTNGYNKNCYVEGKQSTGDREKERERGGREGGREIVCVFLAVSVCAPCRAMMDSVSVPANTSYPIGCKGFVFVLVPMISR